MSGMTTATMIATGATIASAGVGAMGAIQQGAAAKAAGNYNAQVAEQNAALATTNSQFIAAQGEQNVAAQGAENKAKIGAIRANEGASGVQMNTGSSVDVQQSEAKIAMLNSLNVRSQAVKAAYGQQTQAVNDTAQAQLDRANGENAQTGSFLNAGATMLGGIGKAAGYMGGGGGGYYEDGIWKDPRADSSLPWSTSYTGN